MANKIQNGYTEVKQYWTNESKKKDRHSCGILHNPDKSPAYWAIASHSSKHFNTLKEAVEYMTSDGCTERSE